jgi:serine phosphatase RsbU (regulator of sigma subunit)/PAS domain-containing protein
VRKPAGTPGTKELGEVDPVLAEVVRATGGAIGMVYVLPPGEHVLRLVVAAGASQQLTAPWVRVGIDAPIPVADSVREERLVWLGSREDVARRYPRLGFVLPYDFVLASVPITSDTEIRGGLVMMWPASHPPALSATERVTLEACCHRLGMLLGDAHRRGHLMGASARPRTLPPPSGRVPTPAEAVAAVAFLDRLPEGCFGLDLEGRVTFATETAGKLLGVSSAALIGSRPWELLPWLGDSLFEERHRSAVVSRQLTGFTAQRPPDGCVAFQLFPDATGISVWVRTADAPLPGTSDVPVHAPGSAWPGRITALYHLMHLAATLTEAAGVRDVVSLVSDQIVPAFGSHAVALFTAEEGRLHVAGHSGYGAEVMTRLDGLPMSSQAPVARVLSTGFPSFFASFEELQRAYPPAAPLDGMDAWAFLPLIASGRTVGSLVLGYERPRPFNQEERAVLTSLAGLIAQALDRARLYDSKHRLAHTLQAGLLPHALPPIPGLEVAARYLPATPGIDVGGDFYDVVRCGDGRAGVTIGDVQGHNVQAAALMGQVRTAVHAHATAGVSPGDVLTRVNRLLTDLNPGLFTSCLFAETDLAGHRARLATAGHLPPLLRRPGGPTEVLSLAPDLLLGIDPGATYATTTISFPPGSVLVLYTDGLVEAPGTDVDEATEVVAGLVERARDDSMEGLADSLVRHATRTRSRNDDVALLLLRATG